MGGIQELCTSLKDAHEIIVLGSGRESLDVYDFLKSCGIEICCFVDENYRVASHCMFGKKILRSLEARNTYKHAVYIECLSKHSAWGFGGTDYYDYIGYHRNERFYLIKDYMEVEGNSLLHILKNNKVFLLGEYNLCACLFSFLQSKMIQVVGYLNAEQYDKQEDKLPNVSLENIDKNTVCLIVVPEFIEVEQKKRQDEEKRYLETYIKHNGLYDYTDYFSYISSFIDIEKCNTVKYSNTFLMPKRILLGSIEVNSGNVFFRGLLDNHPSIMMLTYSISVFNSHLFWLCVRLSMEHSDRILSLFWHICETEDCCAEIHNPTAFNEKMDYLLGISERFSSQELFIMIHIAYMYMNGKDVLVEDIKKLSFIGSRTGFLGKMLKIFQIGWGQ